MNARKRARIVTWSASLHSVYRGSGPNNYVTANVEDVDEPDRPTRLVLNEDDALRLATRLAQQVGYQLTPVTGRGTTCRTH